MRIFQEIYRGRIRTEMISAWVGINRHNRNVGGGKADSMKNLMILLRGNEYEGSHERAILGGSQELSEH